MTDDEIPKTLDEALALWRAAEPCRREAAIWQLYQFARSVYALATDEEQIGLRELAERTRGHADVVFLAAELLKHLETKPAPATNVASTEESR